MENSEACGKGLPVSLISFQAEFCSENPAWSPISEFLATDIIITFATYEYT